MKSLLVTIFDRETSTHSAPYTFRNEADAERWMKYQLTKAEPNDHNRMMQAYPDQYEMWVVGNFDHDNTIIQQPNPTYRLCEGKNLIS